MIDAMRVTVDADLAPEPGRLEDLVRAGFADLDEAGDVEAHLKAAREQMQRWLVRCHRPAGCGRPVNFTDADGDGHCARTRQAALQRAGDPQAHQAPQHIDVRRTYAFGGRAYPQLPAVARVAEGVRFVVTLHMPADPEATGDTYPRISRYQRYKTAPPITVYGWTEELVHLAAHEARHVHQFRCGWPRSEIDAERAAHARLDAWRGETATTAGVA